MIEAALSSGDRYRLVENGPAWRLATRLPFSTHTNVAVLVAVVWMPLALLSVASPVDVKVPFFLDLVAQVRLLVLIPLYLFAIRSIERGIKNAAGELLEREIVRDRAAYDAIVHSTERLTGSGVADAVVALVALVRSYLYIRLHPPDSWIGAQPPQSISAAGWWYALVALPVVYFITAWWTWRVLVWIYFLGRVSRLRLHLISSHPDRAGGIGFIGMTQIRFQFLAFGASAVFSATIAMQILFRNHSLPEYYVVIGLLLLAQVGLIAAPLLLFTGQMLDCMHEGRRIYGRFGYQYVRDFEGKWIRYQLPDEPALGSADIQSLADLANSYDVVSHMRVVILKREDAIRLIFATALPYLPLLLTMLPATEVLKLLLSVVK